MSGGRTIRGFTLIEVVVAFTVLALVLGVLYPVLSSAARRAALAQDVTQAVALAESRLAEAGVSETFASGVGSGTDGRFAWERSLTPYAPGAWRITVDVRWTHDGVPRAVSLTGLRLEPRP